MRPTIVFPDADPEDTELNGWISKRIRKFADFEIHTNRPDSDTEYIRRIGKAQGILLGWDLPGDVMANAQNLEMVSFTGIGAERFVDMDLARRKGITVSNCPGYSDNTVAEHALALLLAVTRSIPKLDQELRKGNWEQAIPGIELSGKTVGLIGFGGIGRRFAEMCIALGMKVRVWTRSATPGAKNEFGVEYCSLEDVCENCDILSLHLAANAQTEGIISADLIARASPGTILINTARAELVDEDAMLAALSSGQLAAVGLDVFHQEPLPADHPLIKMNNVVITPHIGYNTPEAVERLMDIGVANLERYFAGDPINVI